MTEGSEIAEEVKIFLLEAYEALDVVETGLVDLEKNPGDEELVNGLFRSIHTIKGNAGFLAFPKLETLCHSAETILDKLRSGEKAFNTDIANDLLSAVDLVRNILSNIESTAREGDFDVSQISGRLEAHL